MTTIQQLVDEAGFNWDELPTVFQQDLTDDHRHTTINDDTAIRRIRSLLRAIAPEAERHKDEDCEP